MDMLISFNVNKSFIKFVTDFGPLAIFFFFFFDSNKSLTIAIPPYIVETIIALIIVWFIEKKNSNDSINWWNFNNPFWRIDNIF